MSQSQWGWPSWDYWLAGAIVFGAVGGAVVLVTWATR